MTAATTAPLAPRLVTVDELVRAWRAIQLLSSSSRIFVEMSVAFVGRLSWMQ